MWALTLLLVCVSKIKIVDVSYLFFLGTDATATMTVFATIGACTYWLWATWWYVDENQSQDINIDIWLGMKIMLIHKLGHILRIWVSTLVGFSYG